MPRKREVLPDAVTWLSEKVKTEQNGTMMLHFYEKFKFKNITASIGDYVLISNADSAEPDSEEGCDAAKILALYENRECKSDPFRARVQWYSKPVDLPKWCSTENIEFDDKEVLQDHRSFDTDVSIETFFKLCKITTTFTHQNPKEILKSGKLYEYLCRYRITALSKRKINIEPVMEEERRAIELLKTPKRDIQSPLQKTPNSLTRRMSRVSLSEKNWSISKNDGTKLLLKRAILADKTEKDSPKKSTPKKETPKPLSKKTLTEMISMELEENSDEELPTLIIRQHVPTTPKRKTPITRTTNGTPKKNLDFEEAEKYTTRSGRATVNKTQYYEEELSPVKRTPKRTARKRISSEGSDDFAAVPTPKTPKTPRTPRTPRTSVAMTPKSVSRRIMTSQLTPSLSSRAHSVDKADDASKQNKSLPGRETQLEEILSFVRNKLVDGTSGCMYISGVPGTGKTASVHLALAALRAEPKLPDYQLVEVNGMRIAEPRQAYVQVYKQLTGKTVAWEQACSLLEKRFSKPEPRRKPVVLLVDELDALCTRRQDVLYSIMEWAGQSCARLAVLAVANTMDLPERALVARVASRLGLTRLSFPPYTHAQLQTIVATRLANSNVSPDALQLIARKVAAVSGDARRALSLCERALELSNGGNAGLAEVQRALEEASAGAAVKALRHCSNVERLMIRAVAAEVERTGSDETTLSLTMSAASALTALEGGGYRGARAVAPPPAAALAALARLHASRLVLLQHKAGEPRILLNISVDDVHYATRQIFA